MKRMMMYGLFLALSAASVLAQGGGAGAEAGGSSGSMFGWILAVTGLIVVLVVIARRFSTGEAWKQEVPVIVIGALLLNIGVWRVWATKQDELEKTNRTLQNKMQADQRQMKQLQASNDQLQQNNAQWKQRDAEYQQLIQKWEIYIAEMKKRFESPKSGPVRMTPGGKAAATKAGTGTKTTTKKKTP